MPSLEQTQQLFWKLITAPEGVAAGLATRCARPSGRSPTTLVRRDARLSAVERLDIYADMYFYRIRDCLKEDFASGLRGDRRSGVPQPDHRLPPRASVDLTSRCATSAGICRPSCRRHAFGEQWPYLADLATLEWTILEAFDAPTRSRSLPQHLRRCRRSAGRTCRFTLTPSLRLLDVGWPVHEIWRQTQGGEKPVESQPADTCVRVWRQDLRVFHRPIDAVERAGLDLLRDDASFAKMCEHVTDHAGETEGPARALNLLSGWLADGMLVAYCFEDEAASRH